MGALSSSLLARRWPLGVPQFPCRTCSQQDKDLTLPPLPMPRVLQGWKDQNNLTDCPPTQPTMPVRAAGAGTCHLWPWGKGGGRERMLPNCRALDQGSHPSTTTDLGPIMPPLQDLLSLSVIR